VSRADYPQDRRPTRLFDEGLPASVHEVQNVRTEGKPLGFFPMTG
jgi:hypothetical protein